MDEKNGKNLPIPKAENPENLLEQFQALVEIVKILREHCPWDREQTNESIASLLIEEAYEVVSAIQEKDDSEFSSELGDILLHVVMHSIMAEERKAFSLLDVIRKIQNKLIFRHPHVFGNVEVNGTQDVIKNWEELKKKEGRNSVLDGVPPHLPSLLRAERIQYKASRVGFDWEKANDVWAKVKEELLEFENAIAKSSKEEIESEFGDLLFALVNFARFLAISPEVALQKTNNKFIQRFQAIESYAKKINKKIEELTLGEMDEIWNAVKNTEAKSKL